MITKAQGVKRETLPLILLGKGAYSSSPGLLELGTGVTIKLMLTLTIPI
jgi:hypothetical protein